MRSKTCSLLVAAALLLAWAADVAATEREDLGRALFFDTDLSWSRTQSCATCHNPAHAFVDTRENALERAVSLGHEPDLIGQRNAPSIAYAGEIPPFETGTDGSWRGGLFLDGRVDSLESQAAEPFVNPLEMAMPDHAALVSRVMAKPAYVDAIRALYGEAALTDASEGLRAIADAIAAFERGPLFSDFDSRYDRYLRGEYAMSLLEEQGRRIFFSDLVNCMQCHLQHPGRALPDEPFTNFGYHNIGVPVNAVLQSAQGAATPDAGLGARAEITDPRARGRFRTPSLRNVALTAPYMHNGVFQDLRTALAFYNQYIVNNAAVRINPETEKPWGAPEIADNIDREILRQGQPLDDERITALIAFLRTLTDRRYEHLLPAPAAEPACSAAQGSSCAR